LGFTELKRERYRVRVQKTDVIAGLPASLARDAVRVFAGSPTVAQSLQRLLAKHGRSDALDIAASLASEGFIEAKFDDAEGDTWWETTILGNALGMASFGKPISRATADRLLAGLLERTHEINSNPERLFSVDRVRVFGSYLRSEVDPLGDLDVEVTLTGRVSVKKLADYGRASGKSFSTYLSQLTWAERETVQDLRAKSAAINITREDIDSFTQQSQVVYERSTDPDAVVFTPPEN
jgi:predicted nucleotidyltransferase